MKPMKTVFSVSAIGAFLWGCTTAAATGETENALLKKYRQGGYCGNPG